VYHHYLNAFIIVNNTFHLKCFSLAFLVSLLCACHFYIYLEISNVILKIRFQLIAKPTFVILCFMQDSSFYFKYISVNENHLKHSVNNNTDLILFY